MTDGVTYGLAGRVPPLAIGLRDKELVLEQVIRLEMRDELVRVSMAWYSQSASQTVSRQVRRYVGEQVSEYVSTWVRGK